MIEVRAYIQSIDEVKSKLSLLKAIFKGDYAFTDHIYHPIDGEFDFNYEYVRLRVYQKTAWDQKKIELTHKIKGARRSSKKEFDSIEETATYLTPYRLAFSYRRRGSEYQIKSTRIFLEEIEGVNPSVELISPSQEEIDHHFDLFRVTQILSDSVPKLLSRLL